MDIKEPGQIVDFDSLDASDQQLIKEAVAMRERAYCPISKFQVGAVLRATTGETFTGCNIESQVFSPTVCAERTAICKAVSEGHLRFNRVVVAAYNNNGFTSPCGVCRQLLSEFCDKDTLVYHANPDMKRIFIIELSHLLPFAFTDIPK